MIIKLNPLVLELNPCLNPRISPRFQQDLFYRSYITYFSLLTSLTQGPLQFFLFFKLITWLPKPHPSIQPEIWKQIPRQIISSHPILSAIVNTYFLIKALILFLFLQQLKFQKFISLPCINPNTQHFPFSTVCLSLGAYPTLPCIYLKFVNTAGCVTGSRMSDYSACIHINHRF